MNIIFLKILMRQVIKKTADVLFLCQCSGIFSQNRNPYPDHSFLIHSGHQLYVEIPVRKVLHFQKLFSYLFCQMFLHNLPLSVLS